MRYRRYSAILPVLATIWLLAGCATTATGPNPNMPVTVTALPGTQTAEYQIQPGDTLQLKFYYHPDHDQEVVVRMDGKLLLPLVGEVPAAGLTPAKLAEDLVQAYSKNLRNPKIAVYVKAMNERQVFVGGEVQKPGYLPYRQGLTAMQAMLASGGPKDTAKVTDVVVLKRVGDAYQATKIDLERALEEGDMGKDQELGPSDVVFVPKTTIAKVGMFVQQYILNVIPVRPALAATAPLL